jgi:hypothetical protein
MRTIIRTSLLCAAALTVSAFLPGAAAACGGFFCNRAQPVNQAAEGIIFADNGDGTVTAVIQIQYQGPSQKFSWLLPIASVIKVDSDIGVASNLAFQRLQSATNPNYTLNTKVEGTCREQNFPSVSGGSPGAAGSASASGGAPGAINGGVTVEASGVVGAFEWTEISLDKSVTADPAAAAVAWLTANGYDVPSSAPALLGPYLEQGLYLLALKLTKGADTGSIRPIVLTYQGTQPSIPIKLTAVAANDDMGVLTWVLGKSRSVPQNYLSLELNEARINWFNAASNYNSVVTDAANDAGGQGFVTEFAGPSSKLKAQVWTTFDDSNWMSFKGRVFQSFSDLFSQAYGQYGQWDGFWDATKAGVKLPAGVAFEDFKLCPNCYANQITFVPSAYLAALETSVIQPVKSVQNLIDAHPEMTRMYTTMSADEMTLDPLFAFNADLPDVDNQHTADRIIECDPSLYQFEAPWRIELPQGSVVRGTAADAQSQIWPSALNKQPPNLLIVRSAETGKGKVVEDNSAAINDGLDTYNAEVAMGTTSSTGGAGGSNVGSAGASNFGSAGASNPGGAGASATAGAAGTASPAKSVSGGGCGMAGGGSPLGALALSAALGAALSRRRRRWAR